MSQKARVFGIAFLLFTIVAALAYWRSMPTRPDIAPSNSATMPQPATEEAGEAPDAVDAQKAAVQSAENPALATAIADVPAPERIAALRRVPADLSVRDRALLVEGVLDRTNSPVIRNDMLCALERQQMPTPALGAHLVAMCRDEAESYRWRDYCLQHLPQAYRHADNQPEIRGFLVAAARGELRVEGEEESVPGAFSGTALIALVALAKEDPTLKDTVRDLARAGVEAADQDPDRAVTALQTARRTGDRSVLPLARSLAGDAESQTRLRMSALSVLGELGDASDVPLLQTLAAEAPKDLRRVAAYQLESLTKRVSK